MVGNANSFPERVRHAVDASSAIVTGRAPLSVSDSLDHVAQLCVEARGAGGQLAFIGNGGNAAIAAHMAVDFWRRARLRTRTFDDSVRITAIANDLGYEHVFEQQIAESLTSHDVLLALSSGGKSANILRAVEAARTVKATVVTFSGFASDNPLSSLGDVNFHTPANEYAIVELAHSTLLYWLLESIERRAL